MKKRKIKNQTDISISELRINTENIKKENKNEENDFLSRYRNYVLSTILIIAAALRIITVINLEKNDPTFYKFPPQVDSVGFYEEARRMVDGEISFLGVKGPLHHSPLYSYYLALIMMICGKSLLAIRIFQHLTGIALIFIVYKISVLLFNRRIAIISSLLTAVCPIFIYYESLILREFMTPLFIYSAILSTLLFMKNGKKKYLFFSGILLCAGFFARPNILALFPGFILYLYYTGKKREIIIFCAGFFVLFTLLIFRNSISDAPLFSIEDTGPIAFASGNYYPSTGDKFYYPGDSQKMLSSISDPVEIIKRTYNSHPDFSSIAQLFLKKIYSLFAAYESPNNYSFYFQRNFNSIFYIPLLADILAPIFFCGILAMYFNRDFTRETILLLFIMAIYSIAIIIFYVISRFRIPLYPLYIIFASYLFCNFNKLDNKKKIICSCAFIFFLIVLNLNRNLIKYGLPQYYCNIGFFYLNDLSDNNKAAEYFRKTIEIEKRYDKAYYGLATIADKKNNFNESISLLKTSLEYNPVNDEAYAALALTYFKTNKYQDAKNNFEAALKYNPDNTAALSNYGGLLVQMQLYADAEKILPAALKKNPNDATVIYNLAVLKFKTGKFSESLEFLKSLMQIRPLEKNENYLYDLLTGAAK